MKKPQEPKLSTFDAKSAACFQKRVMESPHHAYKDSSSAICLLCIGSSQQGDVAVNESAIKWLREQVSIKFVRLINKHSKFDITIPLDEWPEKTMRDGQFGRYAFYGPKDFYFTPPFPRQDDESM